MGWCCGCSLRTRVGFFRLAGVCVRAGFVTGVPSHNRSGDRVDITCRGAVLRFEEQVAICSDAEEHALFAPPLEEKLTRIEAVQVIRQGRKTANHVYLGL